MAFSGGGMASGAAGGAMMGAQAGPYGALAGGAIGGLMGAFGDTEGTAPQRVNTWLENPQYDWTQPLLKKQAGFYSDEMDRIQRGEAPSYWGGLETSLRNQQMQPLEQSYFGREGERGGSMVDIAKSAGAMTGLGPRGTNANVTKQLRDFSQERSRIEDYISQLKSQSMENAYNTIPGGINAIDRGPSGQWDNYTIPGSAGSSLGGELLSQGISSGMGSLAGMAGDKLSGMFNKAPGMFNNPGMKSTSAGWQDQVMNSGIGGQESRSFGGVSMPIGQNIPMAGGQKFKGSSRMGDWNMVDAGGFGGF